MMPAMVALFFASFAVTLALLAGTILTGKRGRRGLHLALAVCAIAMLTVTILLTEALARAVAFPAQEMGIHLIFAKSAAAMVIPVTLSGAWTWRQRRRKGIHLACVALFLLLAVVATGTGIWVWSLATSE